ncbi:MAG: hypothetical protein QOI98_2120 [Solirubrobacteraceae bacterium]|nr:hypothetical protein [Solirubrobacteraceae bacterium]
MDDIERSVSDYDRFVTIVEQAADIGRERAEEAIRATLRTLGERISAGEARDLTEELPPELAPWIATADDAEGFDVDEFLRRVAEREGVDIPTAQRQARAVFAALGRTLSRQELADVAAELSKDYAPLLPTGPWVEVLGHDAFIQKVGERAGLDEDRARVVTEAVLETLAERIAGGEVDDLIGRLPVELHDPLKRGKAASGGKATRMSLDEFLHRVAEREGIEGALDIDQHDQLRDHVRAVFLALREAVGDDEFFDVTVELPDEYVSALALA